MVRKWREKGFFNEFEPFVYGFSLQVGPYGIPYVKYFGNMFDRENVNEPFTSSTIDDKNNELYITAEMPGVEKEDIEVNAIENEVVIETKGEKKYYKRVKTPCPVDPDSAKAKYNNGMLEVTLKLKEPPAPKGKTVKIE